MKPIDEMEAITEKGRAILRDLRLERLVNEEYLKQVYEKHKEYFDDPSSFPVPYLMDTRIAQEVLEDLQKIDPNILSEVMDKQYPDLSKSNEELDQKAGLQSICNATFYYVLYNLNELRLLSKGEKRKKAV